MTKNEILKKQLQEEGECLKNVNNLLNEYRETLNRQILQIQKLLGKSPSKNFATKSHFDTKVIQHPFNLYGHNNHFQYYGKLTYIGTTINNDTYVKCFIIGINQYKNLYVKKMKFVDDLAKLIDYFKLIYNVY